MPEVLLDGPCAGMTEQEYDEMRKLDCRVARGLGYIQSSSSAALWTNMGEAWRLRDEDGGVPFYSLDMNGAHDVLKSVCLSWNYRAREKFFETLQKRASYDLAHDTRPAYPDCLVPLVVDLPKHICVAFADTFEYETSRGLDPFARSKTAAEFIDASIEQKRFTEKVEVDGEEFEQKRYNPKPTSTPWIKNVVDS